MFYKNLFFSSIPVSLTYQRKCASEGGKETKITSIDHNQHIGENAENHKEEMLLENNKNITYQGMNAHHK